MTDFRFGVLGPLEVLVDGSPVAITAGKQRVLLAALLVDADRVVSADRLMEVVWGDTPPAAVRNALQTQVMRLRRVLGGASGSPVRTRAPGYVVEVAEGALDLDRFTDLVRRGRAAITGGDVALGADLVRQALGLWRGQPLADVPSEALQREVVPALREQWLDAVELRVEADLALGRHAEVLPELQELTAQHPLRERLWAHRMRALYRCGRQAEALECYRAVSGLLAEELGVDPGQELREVHQQVLTADPVLAPVIPEPASGVHAVPAEVTSFVGRGAELAAGRKALNAGRLVTLTGVGGVGKTRLAMRLAAEAEPEYPDGVCLVDLASLTEPRHLGRTVAEAAGIHDQSMRPVVHVLVEHLSHKRLLLVLDNCEHVVEAVADLVTALLPAVRGLRVLTTSRQALGLVGEHLLVVPPLPVPTLDDLRSAEVWCGGDSAALARYGAVRLLADRAAHSSDVDVLRADPRTVVELCQRLEGIPLAIELAAIRLASLSIHEVRDRLEDRFRLLSGTGVRVSPAYHQTLQAVIDWSHDLCTEPERRLWARLSVFAGEFDLAAACAVCVGDSVTCDNVMDLIAGLVGKSILSAHNHAATTRYRLLETIRQYGRRRLSEHGEELLLRHRHRDYYQNMAEHAAADWCSPREGWWMDRLHRELPNFRVALDFCISRPDQAHAGLDIVHNLTHARCWWFSGTLGEGRHWTEQTLAQQTGSPHPTHAAVLAQAVWIALCQGDPAAATTLLDRARTFADRLDLPDPLPVRTFVEGAHALIAQADARAIPLLAQARDEFRRLGRTGDEHMAALLWSLAAAMFADAPDSYAATGEFLTLAETRGTSWGYAFALWCRGLAELRHGRPHRAAGLFRDALHRQSDTDDHWGPTWFAETLAWATAADGDHHGAAQLLGTAHRMRRLTGLTIAGLRPLHQRHTQTREHLRQVLGADEYDIAYQRGAAAPTYHDALTQALTHG